MPFGYLLLPQPPAWALPVPDFREGFDRAPTPSDSGGEDHYNNQPFRVGERLSRALVADALEGRTSIDEAMRLMSMKSLSTFDEYARRIGAA